MNTYHLKILTKLDSTQYKKIQADSEAEALRKAEVKFPLHKEIEISAAPFREPTAPQEDPVFERKLAEVKLRSREKKARGARKEGWAFLIGGCLIQLAVLLFSGYIILWLAIPIIWGVSRITYGSAELNRTRESLRELQEAPVPS